MNEKVNRYIPELNGLRGIASIIVFIAHSANEGFPKTSTPFISFYIGKGYGPIAVMIFFLLSGYIISHTYLSKKVQMKNISQYVFARIGRILPLYLIMVFFIYILSLFITKIHFPNTFFILSVFCLKAPYMLWTIPIEAQFYGFFIGFWYLYNSEKKRVFKLILYPIIIGFPVIVYYYYTSIRIGTILFYSIFFFTGCFTFILQQTTWLKSISEKIPPLLSNVFFFMMLLNVPYVRKYIGYESSIPWEDPLTLFLTIFAFILIALKPKNMRILRLKFLTFLGNISYSFYLFHIPILVLFKYLFGVSIWSFILTFATTLSISHFSYQYFEKPVALFFKNIVLKNYFKI